MAFLEDQIIPYLGPGFCSRVSCKFFNYEQFHKPVEGCSSFNEFLNLKPTTSVFDPNFTLHYFMDFASNEKWRCHNKQCQISWSEPFHCQGDERCISFQKFCLHFSIPYTDVSKIQGNNLFQSNEKDYKSTALPEFSDAYASDFESQQDGFDFDNEGISIKNLSEEKFKRLPEVHIAENKGGRTTHQIMKESDSKFDTNYAQDKYFRTETLSRIDALCCKCHSQGAKCTNCRCKKSGNNCTNCLPMLNSKCCNQGSAISNKFKPDISTSFPIQTTQSTAFVPQQQTLSEPLSFADQKMIEAFGVTLTNSEGEIQSGYRQNMGKNCLVMRKNVPCSWGGCWEIFHFHSCKRNSSSS